jgi:hypothetical protein
MTAPDTTLEVASNDMARLHRDEEAARDVARESLDQG